MILSIQSHVAYGYVGNRAAVFPLQRLGFDVVAINTVQFASHTGYGPPKGMIFTAGHIQDVIEGLRERGVLGRVQAVVSGYLGTSDLGRIVLDTVREVRALNPRALYCCDPVMGDVGRGIFVHEDIPPFFRDLAMPMAGIFTPNQFELSLLTGIEIVTLDDALRACGKVLESGCQTVLVTSLLHDRTRPGTIEMLVVSQSGETYLVATPRLEFAVPPNGSGDATAALFLGHYLKTGSLQDALDRTATAIYAIFGATLASGGRELALIDAQEDFLASRLAFSSVSL